jgi:hypothetical protein
MDLSGIDGELLIKFFPSSQSFGVIRKEECFRNIIHKIDGSDIGEWQRFVILPAKIKQKVSFYI